MPISDGEITAFQPLSLSQVDFGSKPSYWRPLYPPIKEKLGELMVSLSVCLFGREGKLSGHIHYTVSGLIDGKAGASVGTSLSPLSFSAFFAEKFFFFDGLGSSCSAVTFLIVRKDLIVRRNIDQDG